MSSGSVNLFYEEVDFTCPNPEKIQEWIKRAIEEEKFELSYINIIFCSDEYLLNINQEYLSHDYYTDIITFQYSAGPLEGELFISIDRVTDNAEELGISRNQELKRVIIHGVLHLLGYNDKTEKDIIEMRKKEDFFCNKI